MEEMKKYENEKNSYSFSKSSTYDLKPEMSAIKIKDELMINLKIKSMILLWLIFKSRHGRSYRKS